MKNNLKEKLVKDTKNKSKVLSAQNVNDELNEENKDNLTQVWQNEISELKSKEFATLKEVKEYIVNVVAKKENLANDKEFNEFAKHYGTSTWDIEQQSYTLNRGRYRDTKIKRN